MAVKIRKTVTSSLMVEEKPNLAVVYSRFYNCGLIETDIEIDEMIHENYPNMWCISVTYERHLSSEVAEVLKTF